MMSMIRLAFSWLVVITLMSFVSCEKHALADAENRVLVYLGYKDGQSDIAKLCGHSVKDSAPIYLGIDMGDGVGFEQTIGLHSEIIVKRQGSEKIAVLFEDGAQIEFTNGEIFVYKEGAWFVQSQVKSPDAQ